MSATTTYVHTRDGEEIDGSASTHGDRTASVRFGPKYSPDLVLFMRADELRRLADVAGRLANELTGLRVAS